MNPLYYLTNYRYTNYCIEINTLLERTSHLVNHYTDVMLTCKPFCQNELRSGDISSSTAFETVSRNLDTEMVSRLKNSNKRLKLQNLSLDGQQTI